LIAGHVKVERQTETVERGFEQTEKQSKLVLLLCDRLSEQRTSQRTLAF